MRKGISGATDSRLMSRAPVGLGALIKQQLTGEVEVGKEFWGLVLMEMFWLPSVFVYFSKQHQREKSTSIRGKVKYQHSIVEIIEIAQVTTVNSFPLNLTHECGNKKPKINLLRLYLNPRGSNRYLVAGNR